MSITSLFLLFSTPPTTLTIWRSLSLSHWAGTTDMVALAGEVPNYLYKIHRFSSFKTYKFNVIFIHLCNPKQLPGLEFIWVELRLFNILLWLLLYIDDNCEEETMESLIWSLESWENAKNVKLKVLVLLKPDVTTVTSHISMWLIRLRLPLRQYHCLKIPGPVVENQDSLAHFLVFYVVHNIHCKLYHGPKQFH